MTRSFTCHKNTDTSSLADLSASSLKKFSLLFLFLSVCNPLNKNQLNAAKRVCRAADFSDDSRLLLLHYTQSFDLMLKSKKIINAGIKASKMYVSGHVCQVCLQLLGYYNSSGGCLFALLELYTVVQIWNSMFGQ